MSTFAARSSGAIAALAPAPAIGQGVYLHAIPTEAIDVGPDARADLRLRAFVARPDELAARISGARTLDDHSAEIALGSQSELDPQVADRHRRASFVIDYDEPDLHRGVPGIAVIGSRRRRCSAGILRASLAVFAPDRGISR